MILHVSYIFVNRLIDRVLNNYYNIKQKKNIMLQIIFFSFIGFQEDIPIFQHYVWKYVWKIALL